MLNPVEEDVVGAAGERGDTATGVEPLEEGLDEEGALMDEDEVDDEEEGEDEDEGGRGIEMISERRRSTTAPPSRLKKFTTSIAVTL